MSSFSPVFPSLLAKGKVEIVWASCSSNVVLLSILDLLVGSLLENDVTIRPLITATASPDIPVTNQGQLANLVLDTGAGAGAGASSQPGKKYHRRGKERRFGRGFRLIRNKHPFAEDFKVGSADSSSFSQTGTSQTVLSTSPTVGPLQASSSSSTTQPSQFANQVISLDSAGVTTNTPTTSTNIPLVNSNTFDNQILDSADQTEVYKRDHCSWLNISSRQ